MTYRIKFSTILRHTGKPVNRTDYIGVGGIA